MPATGTEGTTESVAARVMKPAPVMPAAPFERQHGDEQQQDLVAEREVDVAWPGR